MMFTQLSKTAEVKELGNFKKVRADQGILTADRTINNLKNKLRIILSDAYPTKDKRYNMLYTIGLESDLSGGITSDGSIKLDEEKLEEAMKSPGAVEELFGLDTDGDKIVDNGVAYKLVYTLKPFIQPGQNIVRNKIKYFRGVIAGLEERIDNWEEHLENYEDELRTKFANMEKNLSRFESQRRALEQQMNKNKD